jgi:predicted nicotinamide N-methyase
MVNAIQKSNVNVKKDGLVTIALIVHVKTIVMKMDIVMMENVSAKMVILEQIVFTKHARLLVTIMVYAN